MTKTIIQQVRGLCPNDRALQPTELRSVAERMAMKLLRLLEVDDPTQLEAGLERLRWLSIERQLDIPVSGLSHWTGARWLIIVNGDDARVRQRFTLAHELGHVFFHLAADTAFVDRDGLSAHEQLERACDYFAGCLLMPRPAFKAAWTSGLQSLGELAEHFCVSRAAIKVRLAQTSLGEPRYARPSTSVSSRSRSWGEHTKPSTASGVIYRRATPVVPYWGVDSVISERRIPLGAQMEGACS
jgi:Zn-dependent peptidase ImmA (M78 family)